MAESVAGCAKFVYRSMHLDENKIKFQVHLNGFGKLLVKWATGAHFTQHFARN